MVARASWKRAPLLSPQSRRRCRSAVTATRSRHERDRLHRRTAGARPRSGGRPTALSGASTGRARVARVADNGGHRRRSPRTGRARSSPGGQSTSPTTWCTPWGARGRLSRNGSHRRPQFRRSGAARWGSPDRVPRRPRNGRRGVQQASQEPDRDRTSAARQRSPRRGISRVRRDRVREPVVRADPRARRTLAGHGLPAVWLGLVTPVYARVGRELIAGLKNQSVVTDHTALAVFPIEPIGLRKAIGRAIRYEDRAFAPTRWSDARSSGGAPASPADTRFGGKVIDRRQIHVAVDADRAFVPIARIGGERGWYFRYVAVANSGRDRPVDRRRGDASRTARS